MQDNTNLSWWEKLKRKLFGYNNPNQQRTSVSSYTTRSSVHFYDSDPDVIPVVVNNDYALINDLASRMERQADRYENAGNIASANQLRDSIVNVRDSADYNQALAIANSANDGADFQYDNGAGIQYDNASVGDGADFPSDANVDYTGSDFTDNS